MLGRLGHTDKPILKHHDLGCLFDRWRCGLLWRFATADIGRLWFQYLRGFGSRQGRILAGGHGGGLDRLIGFEWSGVEKRGGHCRLTEESSCKRLSSTLCTATAREEK